VLSSASIFKSLFTIIGVAAIAIAATEAITIATMMAA